MDNIERIEIENITQNKYKPKIITITDKSTLNKFCSEFLKLEEVHELLRTNAQFGFYRLTIINKNKKKTHISVIYTIYDGVVIEDSGNKLFKNDELEYLVSGCFR